MLLGRKLYSTKYMLVSGGTSMYFDMGGNILEVSDDIDTSFLRCVTPVAVISFIITSSRIEVAYDSPDFENSKVYKFDTKLSIDDVNELIGKSKDLFVLHGLFELDGIEYSHVLLVKDYTDISSDIKALGSLWYGDNPIVE